MSTFDDLFESLLKEYTPIDIVPGYGGTGEETEAEFPEKSMGKYDLTSEQTKHVAKAVVAKLREMGNHSDKTFKEFQEDEIAPIIKAVTGKSGTNSKYAARVIHSALKSAGIITDERDGGITLDKTSPSSEEMENVVDSAQEIADNGEEVGTIEPETGTEETPTTMKHTKFSTEGTYKLQDVAAGKLKGEEAEAYSALDHAGAYEDINGDDLYDTLKRKGITVSKIKNILNKFVKDEILIRTDEVASDEVGGGEALEAGADVRGLARKHFESDPDMIAAYRDYLSSGGEGLSGREGDY